MQYFWALVLILIILEYIYIWKFASSSHRDRKVLILIILEYIYIEYGAKTMAEKHCLNPYYTGIHLHKMWRIPNQCRVVLILIILEYIYIPFSKEELECLNGLNPYYTGIHLHSKTNWKALFNNFCLNPYYTGIHLHDKIGKYYDRTSVLILIILEYIYIRK